MAIYPDILSVSSSYRIPPPGAGIYAVPATIPFVDSTVFDTLVSNYADGTESCRQLSQASYKAIALRYVGLDNERFSILTKFYNERRGRANSFSFYYPPTAGLYETSPRTYYYERMVGVVPVSGGLWSISLPSFGADVEATGEFAPILRVGAVDYVYDTDYRVARYIIPMSSWGVITIVNEDPPGFWNATVANRSDWEFLAPNMVLQFITTPPAETFAVIDKSSFGDPTKIRFYTEVFPTVMGPALFIIGGGHGLDYEDRAVFTEPLPAGVFVKWSFAGRVIPSSPHNWATRLRILARFSDPQLNITDRYGSGKMIDAVVNLREIHPRIG